MSVSPPKSGSYHPHSRSPFVIITKPVSWYSFYRPTEGGRLSRPKHCSIGAQPVPKAVNRRGYPYKHKRSQWDSNQRRPPIQSLTDYERTLPELDLPNGTVFPNPCWIRLVDKPCVFNALVYVTVCDVTSRPMSCTFVAVFWRNWGLGIWRFAD